MKSSPRQRRVRPLKAKAVAADAEFDHYGPEPNMKLSHAFMVVLALHVIAVGGLFAFNKVKAGHSKVSQKLQTEIAVGQEAVMKEESKPIVPEPIHEMVNDVKKEVAKIPLTPVPQQKSKDQIMVSASPKKILTQSGPQSREGTSTSSVATENLKNSKVTSTAPVLTAAQKEFLATKASSSSSVPVPVAASSGAVTAVANMVTSTAEPAVVPLSEPAPAASAAIEYTVVKRDNPYKIAKRFHVPYDELIKFNNITDPRKIQIGQKLRIPSKTSKAAGQ